jgi:hypothetical protein
MIITLYLNPHPASLASLRRDEGGLRVAEIHYKKIKINGKCMEIGFISGTAI